MGIEREGAEADLVTVEPDVIEPIVRTLPEWLTPLRALRVSAPYTVFLESAGSEDDGEWTLLAFDPAWRLELAGGSLRRIGGEGVERRLPGHPLVALAEAWPARVSMASTPPIPFVSGLAGFLSYDLREWIERGRSRAAREWAIPDLHLGFYDVVWAWRRKTGEGWVVSTGLSDGSGPGKERTARLRLEAQWAAVHDALPASGEADSPRAEAGDGVVRAHSCGVVPADACGPAISNFTRDSYCRTVETALEHIAAGDIYQVNLAQRFRIEPAPPADVIYAALRAAAPAPYLAYVSWDGAGIASSSPERFFRVRGDRIETWPIKGTRPRGDTPETDAALRAALAESAKDRAENVMIVDLERNDLGRVCEIGSIAVPSLCEVTSHANVHHLTSRVEGRLRADAGPVDVIRALFPGGSITGAPKIRSMDIIDSLEPVRRGVYTGAIGYWDVSGDCDWSVAIRTIIAGDGIASFHAGGGIVADSTPEGEYEETLIKASGMMRALGVRAAPS